MVTSHVSNVFLIHFVTQKIDSDPVPIFFLRPLPETHHLFGPIGKQFGLFEHSANVSKTFNKDGMRVCEVLNGNRQNIARKHVRAVKG